MRTQQPREIAPGVYPGPWPGPHPDELLPPSRGPSGPQPASHRRRGTVRANDTPARISAYFTDNQQALLVQALLFALGLGFMLWFIPTLTGHLGRAEGGQRRLASIALVSGVTSVVLTFVALIFQIGLGTAAYDAGQPALVAITQLIPLLGVVADAGPLASGGWLSAYLPYPLYAVWVICAAVVLIHAAGPTTEAEPAPAAGRAASTVHSGPA